MFLGGEVVVDYSLRLKTELGPRQDVGRELLERRDGLHPLAPRAGRRRLRRRPGPLPYGLPAAWGNKVEELIVTRAHELAAEVARDKQ